MAHMRDGIVIFLFNLTVFEIMDRVHARVSNYVYVLRARMREVCEPAGGVQRHWDLPETRAYSPARASITQASVRAENAPS